MKGSLVNRLIPNQGNTIMDRTYWLQTNLYL